MGPAWPAGSVAGPPAGRSAPPPGWPSRAGPLVSSPVATPAAPLPPPGAPAAAAPPPPMRPETPAPPAPHGHPSPQPAEIPRHHPLETRRRQPLRVLRPRHRRVRRRHRPTDPVSDPNPPRERAPGAPDEKRGYHRVEAGAEWAPGVWRVRRKPRSVEAPGLLLGGERRGPPAIRSGDRQAGLHSMK